MHLPANGREYANWTVTGAPEDADFEVQFTHPDNSTSAWVAVETVDSWHVRLLVAGPDATAGTGTVLPKGTSSAVMRLTDTPEIVIRSGGDIDVS